MKISKEKSIRAMTVQTSFLCFLLSFLFISCQTKSIINYSKYTELSLDDKKEVDQYLGEAQKSFPKKSNEIVLMFQYNCFFNKTLNINNKFTESFPKNENVIHYGQKFVNIPKSIENIIITQSDIGKIIIPQKEDYDYISICYYAKENKFFIHYYDFPKLLIVE